MHPSIAQRITVLEGLRARTRLATDEFYQKPNMIAPSLAPQYIVKPSGNNTFEVIERSTGKIIAERFGHNNATGHARELEEKATEFNVKQLGRMLSNWMLRISLKPHVFACLVVTCEAHKNLSPALASPNSAPLTTQRNRRDMP